jgi:hypothetical protein
MMTWKGPWNATNVYAVNDVAEFKGSSYIAVKATTAGQSPESAPASWNLVAGRGSLAPAWKGGWMPANAYSVADAVSYGGASFLALSAITAKSPPPAAGQLWGLLATGLNVRGEWSNTVHYQVGDAVLYKGSTYVAKMANTNVSPTDTNNWQLLARGIPDDPAQWTPQETTALALGITGNLAALGLLIAGIMAHGALATAIATLQAEVAAVQANLQAQIVTLQGRVTHLDAEVDAHELELDALAEANTQINNAITQINNQVAQLAQQDAQLQADLQVVENGLWALEVRVMQARA